MTIITEDDTVEYTFEYTFVRNAVYLVIFYLIIGFNYVGETLGCSIQRAFQQNLVFKHAVNFVGLFAFATVTGARQNPWTALAQTVPLYMLFLVSTRTSFFSITIFLLILFCMYLIDLHKNYFYRNEEDVVVDHVTYTRLTHVQLGFLIVAIVVAMVGCYNYYTLKRIEYSDSWDWSRFIWGVQHCKTRV
jgi:sRNA-binding regulator protein Hfq